MVLLSERSGGLNFDRVFDDYLKVFYYSMASAIGVEGSSLNKSKIVSKAS